ncbi:hypothetical protein NE237_006719 [Protea cynaroides]|uniref:Integrase catalytic domain-containing protein n=1 Tax=Protea cynaroides TaxID=273540 RepID=A0A9Q0QVR2_9MAGN|nr:hypothetical protein NE237_006719 [Protea cynaroides]
MDDLAKLPTICDSFSNLAVVSKVADVSSSSGNDFVCSVGGGNNVDSIVVDGNNVDSNGDDGNCLDSSRFETICNRNDTLVTGTSNTLEALFSSRFQSASEDVWHQRLGHSQRVVGNRLSKAESIKLTSMSKAAEVCTSCQSSKSSKLPIIFRRCSASLDKVHCELWGPTPVTSNQNFRYYVLFVDDYSCFTWFYPLKHKSGFFRVFQLFHSMLVRQFKRSIKVFHCDGGQEFSSSKFRSFLQDFGILLDISGPANPEQNSIAGRKHRHLVKLGLGMMDVSCFGSKSFLG